jgi:hypothetical protein
MDFHPLDRCWIENPEGERTLRAMCPLNRMNGGFQIPIIYRHSFPVEYYGKPGTFGTNDFSFTLGLKRERKTGEVLPFAKLDDIHHFFPGAKVNLTEDESLGAEGVKIFLPANAIFDKAHTLQDTIAYFQTHMATIWSVADYLQAQQKY